MAHVLTVLDRIDRRTRHMMPAAAAALASRFDR
jgi:hypothetical protein